ncbi:MAG: permease-like cell division protein FtsX [Lachnospiraceae bacterium]|nr:permease-like cell division protein FtsX [Lachnospiraceae bacterium]
MRISTFFYTLKQGIINIFRNKWYSLASIATIGACLVMFGIFYSIVMNFQYMVKGAQENVAVTVFFEEGTSEERIQEIGSLIQARAEVSNIRYISDQEAWDSFKDDYLGEYADGFPEDDNPLEGMSNYEVYLNDVSMQKNLVTYIESIEDVREVRKSELTANALTDVNGLISLVSIGIIVILLAVSIFLISNTVTIGISVRKEEISIMKYIGATDFFVRSPFVIEGILIGLVGSFLPLVLLYFIYNNVIDFLRDKFSVLSNMLQFLTVQEIFATLIPVSIIIGVGIGFLGSFVTVRKHIRV